MRSPLGVVIFILFSVALDAYMYQALKTVSQSLSPKARIIVYSVFFTISVLTIIGFLLFVYTDLSFLGQKIRTYLFAIIIGLTFAKMIGAVFFLIDDIRRLFQWIAGKVFFEKTEVATISDGAISRSKFLSWVGLTLGGTLFGSLVYGFGNQYNYQVKPVKLKFPNLPNAFKGFKIVHISDIHSGSLLDKDAVLQGIELILKQAPDMILFTGDIVNDKASEMDAYKEIFSKLHAPYGVYSTLGNHDYGDYVAWPVNGVSKEENLERLKQVHADMGWKLMMNEHKLIEKNGESFALIGIENWSAKIRFPKHGKMQEAYAGTENVPFKILMSHDPSHWDAQVIPEYGDVDLTLSGHTHGMQFGFKINSLQWSPVQYVYKQWGGLYETGKQKLYVNPGFGFIGYPGRVGILPEITVIELG
jgi:hypothetical protein